MSDHPARRGAHHERHRALRLVAAVGLGALAAALAPLPEAVSPLARVLVGFTVTALAFAVPLLVVMLRATPEQTQAYADGLDPGASVTDLLILLGSLASLGGVALMLLLPSAGTASAAGGGAGSGAGGGAAGSVDLAGVIEAGIAVTTVFCAWVLVHTMFALRYARHWHNAQEGCIDFHMTDPPAYSDFTYLAFAIGASFAVSDTDLKTTEVRRIALRHSWLSYLFGTVIVAATINLIAGLAG